MIEAWSAESQITVSAGPRIVPIDAGVGAVAGREDERLLCPHPIRELGLEFDVEGGRPVQEARAGQTGAVAVERIASTLADPLVARQPEVVVRAEHHDLAALDLHQRPGLGLDQAEVGEEVVLARGFELLHAVVGARLGEYVNWCPCGL